ncbi:MAG TPA: CPBP family intramembrane glutamic endopeptidase [Blastococcus sp.]|jgi:membrane protease YdiL (CAAX protease family)|nr:CPBP family intramembrane glutamic endopeptidase [Nocardioides sp.]HYH27075.1 CPBP family intramembrane glutamic endopeptidase [Blastococcus sp.]
MTHIRTAALPTTGTLPAGRPAIPQLEMRGILGVWAAAAIPMGLLAWVFAPWFADQLSGPGAFARAMIVALTVGLAWQFVLTMALVRREQGTLRWVLLREVLWLHSPTSPTTGRRGGRLWWILLPLVLLAAAKDFVPKIPHAENLDFFAFVGTDEGRDFLSGAWGWFAVLIVMAVFNTVLGEELLFRGYLLPRMNGVFGRRDWIANGVLFGLYHLHRWWAIPGLLFGILTYAWPAKHYRSALVSIAVHSAQSVVLVVLVLPLVLQG